MLTEARLIEQVRALRAKNEELLETIRQLREAAPEPLPADVPYLSHREELVFRALMDGRGVVTRETIYLDIYGANGDVLPQVLAVFISHMRRKLTGTRYSIETIRARGWRLHIAAPEALAA